MIRVAVILAVTARSGCTTTRTVVVETPLATRIPSSLLECSPRPTPGARSPE